MLVHFTDLVTLIMGRRKISNSRETVRISICDSEYRSHLLHRNIVSPQALRNEGTNIDSLPQIYLYSSRDTGLLGATTYVRCKNCLPKTCNKSNSIIHDLLGMLDGSIQDPLPSDIFVDWADFRLLLVLMHQLGIALNERQMQEFYKRYFCSEFFNDLMKEVSTEDFVSQVDAVTSKEFLLVALFNRGGMFVTPCSESLGGLNREKSHIFRRMESKDAPKVAAGFLRGNIIIEDACVLSSDVGSALRNWWELVIAAASYSGIIKLEVVELRTKLCYCINPRPRSVGCFIDIQDPKWEMLGNITKPDPKNRCFISLVKVGVYGFNKQKGVILKKLARNGAKLDIRMFLLGVGKTGLETVVIERKEARIQCPWSSATIHISRTEDVSIDEFDEVMDMIKECKLTEFCIKTFDRNVLADILVHGVDGNPSDVPGGALTAEMCLEKVLALKDKGIVVYVRTGGGVIGRFSYKVVLEPEALKYKKGKWVIDETGTMAKDVLRDGFVLESGNQVATA